MAVEAVAAYSMNMDHSYSSKEPKRAKRGSYCSVPQCSTYRSEGISFHLFPKNEALRKKWEVALKMGKNVSDTMLVCSNHFLESDYFPGANKKKQKHLKLNTVPSQNLPVRSHDHKQKCHRRNPLEMVRERASKSMLSGEEDAGVPSTSGCDTAECDTAEVQAEVENPETRKSSCTRSTQTETFKLKFSFVDLLNSNSNLYTFTGLHSFDLLDTIVECVSDIENVNRKKEMGPKNRVLLAFIKLKLNLCFTTISVFFTISRQTCVNYFKNIVPLLSKVLQSVIPWPDQDTIRQNIPISFKNFKNTRIVLDCAETPIERSKCIKCRILSWSNYKGKHTAKFDVGIVPSGMIVHLSKAYGGRASDKFIVNHSGILNRLDFQDAVMVDKGFRIEGECLERNLILHRPPFVKQKKPLSRKEALTCAEIARARVHVERTIQRLREFLFLKETVPWEMIPFFDDALIIAAGIVNLSAPTQNIDKFL